LHLIILSLDISRQFINNENIMKITIYTITDCQFSKQEKEYLSAHGIAFEEKNLETNREFLTEMLAVGSNFAGTPVTKIEKDDGQIAVLKGFTAAEFDKTLGIAAAPSATPVEQPPVAQASAPPVVETAPVAPAPVAPPVVAPQPEVAPPAPVADPAMASVLDTLQQQAQAATQPMPGAAPEPTVPGQPVIPDPQF
jgi:glutaredoxin-like protein NrdH